MASREPAPHVPSDSQHEESIDDSMLGFGVNAALVEEIRQRYDVDPSSVHENWAELFGDEPQVGGIAASAAGRVDEPQMDERERAELADRHARVLRLIHAFRARDGWFTIEVVREPHFPRFAEAVGHPEWSDDPRLATRAGWSEQMEDVIRPAVEAWASTRTRLEAATVLARHGVAAGPVNDAESVLNDPHVQARSFVHHPLPSHDVAVVGNPIAFRRAGAAPEKAPRRWPTLGEDTERVLRERLGLDSEAIRALRDEGNIA